MGHQVSYMSRYRPDDWRLQEKQGKTILTNLQSGIVLNCFHVIVEHFGTASRQFEKRFLDLVNVVSVYDLVGWRWTCGSSQMAVLTQDIHYSLAEHNEVKLQDCLIILEESLYGFREVAQTFDQYFLVNDRMIFLNGRNQVRVWMHPDLTRNQPYKACLLGFDPEQQMIQSILNTVERHCAGGFPPDLKLLISQTEWPLRFNVLIKRLSEYDIRYQDQYSIQVSQA